MKSYVFSPFEAFLRHRYRAHVQGWLGIFVGLLWGYYIEQYSHEPLWAVVPAAYVVAFCVVAMGVAAAALLRLLWWPLLPLTFVSMALEWALRKLMRRPWQRRPQPRERWLSNPFAWWQKCRLHRRRHQRGPRLAAAPLIPLPTARAAELVPHQASRSSRPPARSAEGWGAYVAEAFAGHWTFWMFSAPLWILLWLWWIDDQMFVVALILALLLWFIASAALLIPIAAALLALGSAFLVGAGLTPLQRQAEVGRQIAQLAARVRVAAAHGEVAKAQKQPMHWLWPLLLGLWIGSAWGGDE